MSFSLLSRGATRTKKRKVGHGIGQSNTKSHTTTQANDGGINTRNLYKFDLLQIPKSNSNERRDERVRDVVNFRGWKICWQLRNDTQKPMIFHWAIIQPKRPGEFGLSQNDDFFRDNGSSTRAVDFSNGLTCLDFDCNAINTDTFNVIHHKKLRLGPKDGDNAFVDTSSRNWMFFQKYIDLKRQIRYNSAGNPESALYFVYWCDTWGS